MDDGPPDIIHQDDLQSLKMNSYYFDFSNVEFESYHNVVVYLQFLISKIYLILKRQSILPIASR